MKDLFRLGDQKREEETDARSYILYGSAPVNPVGLGIGINTCANERTKSPTILQENPERSSHEAAPRNPHLPVDREGRAVAADDVVPHRPGLQRNHTDQAEMERTNY